jgi:glycine/D-amino acid oxidase-like deaminating enzyme
MKQVDFLIIGQGLCGTWLSWYLQKENKSFIVIDKNEENTPSKISPGIINPVTGRRMVTVWEAEKILPFAWNAYKELGNFLDIEIIFQKTIIDFFPSVQMHEEFFKRINEGSQYLNSFSDQIYFERFFNYHLGCGEIRPAYIVNLEKFLSAWRKHLNNQQQLLEENFKLSQVDVSKNKISYANIQADKIIFCDGINSFANPLFKQLPFAPNKGEVLIVEIPDLPADHIYKKGMMLSPLPEKKIFSLGSNYQWEFKNVLPTEEFISKAKNLLHDWLKLPFKILDHRASIRPATLERRPFVGLHPHHNNVGILNGMGTKGCSLAPYFANQLMQNLVSGKQIDPLADINRFRKILSRSD